MLLKFRRCLLASVFLDLRFQIRFQYLRCGSIVGLMMFVYQFIHAFMYSVNHIFNLNVHLYTYVYITYTTKQNHPSCRQKSSARSLPHSKIMSLFQRPRVRLESPQKPLGSVVKIMNSLEAFFSKSSGSFQETFLKHPGSKTVP